MKAKNIIFLIAIVILLIIFGISAYYVADYFINSKRQSDRYDDLAAMVESARKDNETQPDETAGDTTATDGIADPDASEVPDSTENTDPTEPQILPEYQALYELNPDLVGWIQVDDTKINYPVMQRPETKDYYLYRNFDENWVGQGCIYVREECDVFEPSDNLTIYGHYMVDGSMFGSLHRYQFETFWEEHQTIRFDTIYEHHEYQVFAVFKTTASIGEGFSYHKFVDAADQEEFDAFIAEIKRLDFYDTGITPEYGDKIICLSTCEYTLENGRLVICAVRTD